MAKVKKIKAEHWQLIAETMALEERRVRHFVGHRYTLGVAREAILRGVLINQTPIPLQVGTGFIAIPGPPLATSKQCDILVFDPSRRQPLYRQHEFVVIPPSAAKMIIEVRATMTTSAIRRKKKIVGLRTKPRISGLEHVFAVANSALKFHAYLPVFGYGFDGPDFGTFVAALFRALGNDILNAPECFAVQNKNYVAIRILHSVLSPRPNHPAPELYVAVDFSKCKTNMDGLATADFLGFYDQRVRGQHIYLEAMRDHVNKLGLPANAIHILEQGGKRRTGPL